MCACARVVCGRFVQQFPDANVLRSNCYVNAEYTRMCTHTMYAHMRTQMQTHMHIHACTHALLH